MLQARHARIVSTVHQWIASERLVGNKELDVGISVISDVDGRSETHEQTLAETEEGISYNLLSAASSFVRRTAASACSGCCGQRWARGVHCTVRCAGCILGGEMAPAADECYALVMCVCAQLRAGGPAHAPRESSKWDQALSTWCSSLRACHHRAHPEDDRGIAGRVVALHW